MDRRRRRDDARIGEWVEWLEEMDVRGLKRLLPEILKDAAAREALATLAGTRWKNIARAGTIAAIFAAVSTVGSLIVAGAALYVSLKAHP
jgi:hypothetical protein